MKIDIQFMERNEGGGLLPNFLYIRISFHRRWIEFQLWRPRKWLRYPKYFFSPWSSWQITHSLVGSCFTLEYHIRRKEFP